MKKFLIVTAVIASTSISAYANQTQRMEYQPGPATECSLSHPDYNICVRNRNFQENSVSQRLEPASGKLQSSGTIQSKPDEVNTRIESSAGYAPSGTVANPAQR